MPKKEGFIPSKTEAPDQKIQTTSESAKKPTSPESQAALDYYLTVQKLIDDYKTLSAQYALHLDSQKTAIPATAEQKQLKSQLREMWNRLHDSSAIVKEHEYMADDESVAKKMRALTDHIQQLPGFTGQENEDNHWDKIMLDRNTDTVLKNRESGKERAKEHLRNQEKVKAMRKQMAKLKSSFAGSYKISTMDASALLPQINALHKNQGAQKSSGGILGWVKNIAGAPDKPGSKFTNQEKTKFLAYDLTKFKADLKDIQQKEKEFNNLWEQVQKAEKDQNFDFDETFEPDDSISIMTLREGFSQEIQDAHNAGDNKKALQLKQELDEAYENLQKYFPELLQVRLEDSDHPERTTILPPRPEDISDLDTLKQIVPPAPKAPKVFIADDFSAEEPTIPTETTRQFESVDTLKTKQTEELESAITLKTEQTKKSEGASQASERQAKIDEVINSFGGGEKGRTKAAQMWDDAFIKLYMVERSGILKPNQKIGNAMDYVHANATMQMKATEMERLMAEAEQKIINDSIESFGGGKAGQAKYEEIWNLANQMMGKESSEAEVQRQFGFTRMEYVEAWADLSKAYIDKNDELIKAMELRVYNLTKKLLGEEGKKLTKKQFDANWNLLAGSGASRLNKMQGIGQNRSRQESGVQTKKISGMEPAQPIIGGSRSIEYHNDHEAFSVDWTMNLLPTAEIKWKNFVDTFFAKSKTKGEKEAMLIVINDEIETLVEKLQAMSNISEEYRQLDKILKITAGDPPEATRYVMLKVFTDGAFIGTETNDAKAKKAVSDTIKKIDKKLAYLSQEIKKRPTLRQPKKLPDTLKDEVPPTLKDEAPPTLQDEAPPTLEEEEPPTLKITRPKSLRKAKKPDSLRAMKKASTMRKF